MEGTPLKQSAQRSPPPTKPSMLREDWSRRRLKVLPGNTEDNQTASCSFGLLSCVLC
jgi:hypothetical protein